MSDSSIIFLVSSLPITLIGIAWVMVRIYSRRLSRIDDEFREIKVMLSEIPKETSLKEYIFAQDQRLRGIGDKLDTHPDTDMLHQCIQDQANQVIAFVSTHSEDSKSRITKADLEVSLQRTNELLEKALWSLRFDEDKYVEDADTDTSRDSPEDQGKKNINIDTKSAKVSKDKDDHISMKSILDDSNDSYGAILKYMQQSGKGGTEALQELEAAKAMHNH